jgi:3-methyladenine DNA glycosylase/8-oxoguanine DNA glycosylase
MRPMPGPSEMPARNWPSFDPQLAIEHLRRADAVLGGLVDSIGPFRLDGERQPTIFAALAEAIVYQQLTGKAAATIFARLCALFPGAPTCPTPEELLAASEEELRGAGLSRAKILSLRDLARRAADGEIPDPSQIRSLDDEAVIACLTPIRGIGRWTAEMLLIFHLGRPDVLPADDYGVRKGFAIAYDRALPSPKELAAYGARWQPYRTVASWYLWRVVERATARNVTPFAGAHP